MKKISEKSMPLLPNDLDPNDLVTDITLSSVDSNTDSSDSIGSEFN